MKNGLRKTWLAAMCLLLCAALLGGCADKQQPQTPAFGTADNEIFTYTPVEQGKTPLVVSVTGNLGVSIDHIIEQFEQEHPDVQVFYLDITGGTNAERPYLNWIERGPTPDIMFMGNTMYQSIDMKKSFVNLSSTPYLEVFHTDSLNRLQVDGDIYVLPGPSSVTCMVYNKTLFERYGWEVPGTFDEFVTLCARIKADTNGAVEPWNPNAKYDGEIVKALQGFFYASLFAGVENRTLYNQFIAGGEGYAEHIRPMFEGVQRLVDEGIIRNEHFTYSATSRQNEFVAGKIAMINVPAKRIDSDEYTFGYMPFPGENPGDGYIADTLSCTVGMTKKERGEKELAAAEAFMAFYASVETQKVFSRIRCKMDYKPKKKTAVAFAIALKLDMPTMLDLLSRAEIAFSPSNKFDLIITYFVTNGNYDIFEINAALFKYGQPILGE